LAEHIFYSLRYWSIRFGVKSDFRVQSFSGHLFENGYCYGILKKHFLDERQKEMDEKDDALFYDLSTLSDGAYSFYSSREQLLAETPYFFSGSHGPGCI